MGESVELRPMGASRPPAPPPRHPETSAGGLGRAYRAAEDKAKASVHLQEGGMDTTSTYGVGVAIWYSILAVPLLLFPRILLFFAQVPPPPGTSAAAFGQPERESHYDALTPLESFLCLSLSLGLLAFSLIAIFALVPTYEPPTTNPSRTSILSVIVGINTVMALVSLNTKSVGGLGTVIGIGNTLMAVWGWWVVVFGMVHLKEKKSRVPSRLKKL